MDLDNFLVVYLGFMLKSIFATAPVTGKIAHPTKVAKSDSIAIILPCYMSKGVIFLGHSNY
jgi:hypothetical protein